MVSKMNSIKIIKRDGREKSLNPARIRYAIDSASLEVGKYNENDTLGVDIAEYIEDYLLDNHIECIGVEEVQDLVIERLKVEDIEVAKAYKKYREERERQRNHPIDKQILELLEGTNEFLAKENANKNASLLSTQRDLMAGTISRNLALRYKIPKKLADAHNEGLIKLHDLDYFVNNMTNCSLIPLEDLFTNGTVINDKEIETPKSLSTAMTLATQIITQVASFQYGGCSISLAHIAPYVKVSKDKFTKLVIEEGKEIGIEYSQEQIDKIVNKRLKKEIKDSVQTFNYQISTMNSTNGQLAVYNRNIINY